MTDYTIEAKAYLDTLCEVISRLDVDAIDNVVNAIIGAYDNESTIYIFGNGGSAATASHIVCDFNKGASIHLDRKFRFICLNDNIPTMMAIANDCGYEHIFSMQLEGKLKTDDLIIAISGSGNSRNVIEAVEYAKGIGCKVIGLTGYSGGKLRELCGYSIHADIEDMQKTEDVHMIVNHLIAQVIARRLGHPLC